MECWEERIRDVRDVEREDADENRAFFADISTRAVHMELKLELFPDARSTARRVKK
jgi:hypothetical protein